DRPFLLAPDLGFAIPGPALFADADAVARRLAIARYVVQKALAGIDDHGALGLIRRIVDLAPPELVRNLFGIGFEDRQRLTHHRHGLTARDQSPAQHRRHHGAA